MKFLASIAALALLLVAPQASQAGQPPISPPEARAALLSARKLPATVDRATVKHLFYQADRAYDSGMRELAREIVEILLKTKHRDCEMYCFLSDSYFQEFDDRKEETLKARQYLNEAIKLDPNCSRAYNELAYLDLSQDKLADALRNSDKAVACKDPHLRVHLVRSKIMAAYKRYPEALSEIILAEKAGSTRTEIFRVKGSLLEKLGRYDEAVTAFEKAFAMQRQDWSLYQMAHCLTKAGKFGVAISKVNMILAVSPGDSEAYRERAEIKVKAKDYAGAIKDFDKTLELEPTAKGFRRRAEIHVLNGSKEKAAKDLAEADNIMNRPGF